MQGNYIPINKQILSARYLLLFFSKYIFISDTKTQVTDIKTQVIDIKTQVTSFIKTINSRENIQKNLQRTEHIQAIIRGYNNYEKSS